MTPWFVVALGLLAGPAAQEKPTLSFPAQAEIILVDVVVLDDKGRPVRGLAREDFTVLEDGRPQAVVGFEARDMAAPGSAPGAAAPATPTAPASSPAAVSRGRTIALVVDDLGIAPLQVTALKQAVKSWLDAQADPRDEVTLVTSSGDLWWSDTVGSGKADLLAVLDRVQSKKPAQGASDYMTDIEAYRIDTYEDATGAREASAGPPGQTAGPPTGPTPTSGFGPANITGRVAARWAGRGCVGNCTTQVRQRAREIQDRRIRRTHAVFGAVERLSKAMAGSRGRKTIVVFSDGLIRDSQIDADDRAADAAQLGNTAVSFVDTKGLAGSQMLGLDQATATLPGDLGLMYMEEAEAAAGTAYLAEETGGSVVRGTNDIAEGLGRVVDESSAYYLLGYEPPKTPDGKWHKLEVKVSRPGVNVRARRRYFAASGPERKGAPSAAPDKAARAKREDGDKLPARAFDPAILTSGEDTLPVRIAPYVMDPGTGGHARVLVALEVDVAALALGGGEKRTARLDLTLMGVSRDQPKTDLLDQRLDLELDPKNAAGWFTLSRELKLPAGVSQVRALVRDVSSGRMGRAWSRFQVPVLGEPYLSTPVLTDKMEKQEDGTPRLVPVAHREFRAGGTLFLQYEVHGMGGNARVGGGYRMSTATGDVIATAERTPITRAGDGRLVRILGFPLEGLQEGEYQIVLDVLDDASGKRLAARLPFRLASATP